jgi:superfamily II DNA/RNA helicase
MLSAFSLNLALPDLWQQEAVRHLKAGKDVIVDAPTGAGKTHIFELLVKAGLSGQAIYTVPTRALANDKRQEWKNQKWDVGITTGDVAENIDAPVVVATLETQRERFLRGQGPRILVIDEYQMLADPVRGVNYELGIALAPKNTQLLLLSGSVANPKDVQAWLQRLGRSVEIISSKIRPVPLEEVGWENLPQKPQYRQIQNFWPKVAAAVLGANLGPLLIFAPQRSVAEKLARQIAGALRTPDTIKLTEKQEHQLGGQLSQLLRQRVAYHHSGLSYQQRAGIIEPLAKAGQLRVVVATMGLAAGINFSMRSVAVTEGHFFDGKYEHYLAPDELLQMFGRAGRRGKDDTGYVITTNRSPRLSDAAPKHLRRSNQVDWPNLIRIMDRAAEKGQDPFAAASLLCDSLFSKQHIMLGIESNNADANPPEQPKLVDGTYFGLEPTRVEVFNSVLKWEDKNPNRIGPAPLGTCRIIQGGRVESAMHVYPYFQENFPIGRVCKIQKNEGGWVYGKEFPLAVERQKRVFELTRNVRELLQLPKGETYTYDQLEDKVLRLLVPHLCGGRVLHLVTRQEIIVVQIDYSRLSVTAYFDSMDLPIITPDERLIFLNTEVNLRSGGQDFTPRQDTAAHAWRKLGLIDENGRPTRRGQVFSYFQAGEGLAIAAALEQADYALEELVHHLANLRGGHRLSERQAKILGGSERLASACLGAYGAANYEGYLELGLPIGYTEGTAELLAELLHHPQKKRTLLDDFYGEGDFERALVEWLSLLRQVGNAPSNGWERWEALQQLCRQEQLKYHGSTPSRELLPLPAGQLQHSTNHSQFAVG